MKPPYPGWRPYCLMCKSMLRMLPTEYGFQCSSCKNQITHDLVRHSVTKGER